MFDIDNAGVVMYGMGNTLRLFTDWIECEDESSFTHLIQQMWGVMLFDIDVYIFEHAELRPEQQLILWSYLLDRPLDQRAIQRFLDQHFDTETQKDLVAGAVMENQERWFDQLGIPLEVAAQKLAEFGLVGE